jgi:hypothetical protein
MRPMSARAPAFFVLAMTLGLVPSGLGATSCATEFCTLVGCDEGLALEFDETVPRDYTVTVTVDGKTDTADCTAAAIPDATAEASAGLPALETSVICGTDELIFAFSPTSLSIVITFPDGVTTTVDAKPAYEDFYPNGEDCEPTCRRATYEVDIHAPGG